MKHASSSVSSFFGDAVLHRIAGSVLCLLVAVCALRDCGGLRTAAMAVMAALALLFVVRGICLLCRKGLGGGWRIVERMPGMSSSGFLLVGASVLYGQGESRAAAVFLALAVLVAAGLLLAGVTARPKGDSPDVRR